MTDVKGVGKGVQEYRLHKSPGYRIYFGREGDTLVILLGGGTKRTQDRDIERTQEYWADYKKRKKKEK